MEKTNKRIVLGMVDENGFEQDNRLYFRGGDFSDAESRKFNDINRKERR